MTCSSIAASAHTRGPGSSASMLITTCSPSTRPSILATRYTTSSRRMGTRLMICLRLNTSSWRVNDAARSLAAAMPSTDSRRESCKLGSASTRERYTCWMVRRLLKSCAIPAASRPMDSSFCIRRTIASLAI